MIWKFFNRRKSSYLKLVGHTEISELDSDNDEPFPSYIAKEEDGNMSKSQAMYQPRHSPFACRACSFIVIFLSLLIGFVSGQFLRSEYNVDGYLAPYANPSLNINHIIWTMNNTFTSPPSKANEDAWSALMPFGRGFISHPTLTSGSTKALSAFHQIHCLHGLRTAYYAQTNKLDKLKHRFDHSHRYTPNVYLNGLSEHELGLHHVKHCFEYLRQAIMCAADTNLEPVSVDLDGNTVTEPWMGERVCRDWEGVRMWAEKWHVGDGEGIVGK